VLAVAASIKLDTPELQMLVDFFGVLWQRKKGCARRWRAREMLVWNLTGIQLVWGYTSKLWVNRHPSHKDDCFWVIFASQKAVMMPEMKLLVCCNTGRAWPHFNTLPSLTVLLPV